MSKKVRSTCSKCGLEFSDLLLFWEHGKMCQGRRENEKPKAEDLKSKSKKDLEIKEFEGGKYKCVGCSWQHADEDLFEEHCNFCLQRKEWLDKQGVLTSSNSVSSIIEEKAGEYLKNIDATNKKKEDEPAPSKLNKEHRRRGSVYLLAEQLKGKEFSIGQMSTECPGCGAIYRDVNFFREHLLFCVKMRQKAFANEKVGDKWKCSGCKYETKDEDNFLQHCDLCTRRLELQAELLNKGGGSKEERASIPNSVGDKFLKKIGGTGKLPPLIDPAPPKQSSRPRSRTPGPSLKKLIGMKPKTGKEWALKHGGSHESGSLDFTSLANAAARRASGRRKKE